MVSLAPGERGGAKPTPLSPLSPPPPGLFPRKLYQCGHARRRHLGRLVSRSRARKRVFPAWPLAAAEPLVALPPACGGSGRLPASPSGACGAPRTGWFLLLGHILSRRRSAPSLRTLTPPPQHICGGAGAGVGVGAEVLVPLLGFWKRLQHDQEHKFQGHNLFLWVCEVAVFSDRPPSFSRKGSISQLSEPTSSSSNPPVIPGS